MAGRGVRKFHELRKVWSVVLGIGPTRVFFVVQGTNSQPFVSDHWSLCPPPPKKKLRTHCSKKQSFPFSAKLHVRFDITLIIN